MSLDSIQLAPALIQSLYGKSLYELKVNKSGLNAIQEGQIVFLGSNQKKIVLLVDAPETSYLPEEALAFLLGILSACQLNLADIALINRSKNPGLNYTDIQDQLDPEKILMFGIEAETLELPMQFPRYQIQSYDGRVYLSTASLDALKKNKAEKMKLWNCLKKIFSVT